MGQKKTNKQTVDQFSFSKAQSSVKTSLSFYLRIFLNEHRKKYSACTKWLQLNFAG